MVAQSTTLTVTTLGSLDGSSARQSPTCRSIHVSLLGFRVFGGAATAVVVIPFVDLWSVDWAGLRSVVPQAGSRITAANEPAQPNPAFMSASGSAAGWRWLTAKFAA